MLRRSNPLLSLQILMSKVCSGGVIIVKNGFKFMAIADAPIGCKYCTIDDWHLCMLFELAGFNFWISLQRAVEINNMRTNNVIFRLMTTGEFADTVERRIKEKRSKRVDDHMRMLIPQCGEKVWGEKRIGNKVDMISEMIGYKPKINRGRDEACMEKYLGRVSRSGLDRPSMLHKDQFLPAEAPLLDYLVESTRHGDGWKYPRVEDLSDYQDNRGLNLEMLQQIEVRELVCGVSSRDEILHVIKWINEKYTMDQDKFANQVLSFDVEDVKTTYYDTLRMAGKVEIPGDQARLRTELERERIHGYGKDEWRQVPGKIMFGNGVTWTCLISLDLEQDKRARYWFKKMEIQPEIVELLRDLPVVTGLAIRRDLMGVEEFYSLVSGTEFKLERGYLDLTSLAILAGYKFHARNMTAMGVQVIGTLLNKNVSTGDNLWGLRWSMIPKALQCYALGDIRFGFITYNVLAGLLMRDVFPDPDVVCRFLGCGQRAAVEWVLEFIMITLEGVSYHQAVEEAAGTREEMIRSLRFRGENGKLSDVSPPMVQIWRQILGSWPSITSGGCRFLIQSREWFLVQIRVLVKAQINWSNGRVLREPRDDDLEYSRFGLLPEEVGDQTWREPVSEVWRMTRPVGVKIPLLKFEVSHTKPAEIGRRCTALGRCQRWSLLEWERMNPENRKVFFVRMIRDPWFQTHYANLYDAMRLCYLRVVDEEPPKVTKVEEILNKAVGNSLEMERANLERIEAEAEVRRARVNYLMELQTDWTFKERSRWSAEVPALPSVKSRGSRKRKSGPLGVVPGEPSKRVRSKSIARVGPFDGDAFIQPASQPAPESSGVGNGFVGQDDGLHQGAGVEGEMVVLLNEDDLGTEDDLIPDFTRRVLAPGQKGNRMSNIRRSVGKVRALTYDEMIEGPEESGSVVDDLVLEFEVPKEVEDIEV